MAAFTKRSFRLTSIFKHGALFPRVCPRTSSKFLHRNAVLYGIKGTEIKMPSLSPTMTEGTIIAWLKKEGDTISPGEVLCEVQTDKAVVGFEMEEEGVLAKIVMPSDSKDVKIGTLIALMVEEGQDWKDVEVPEVSAAPVTPSTPAPSHPKQDAPVTTKQSTAMGPVVRALLEQYGLNADQVKASGPHNTLLKGDVLSHVASAGLKPRSAESAADRREPTKPQIPAAFVDIPLTNMRKVIAKRLTESKMTIPHSYMYVEANVGELVQLRQRLKDEGIMVSVNDMIIKAVAVALQNVPEVNVTWLNETAQYQPAIDISIAVATESGLITPIIKNADQIGIPDISATVKDLATRAKAGKLQPHEFQGGTFSISNLGMFGIKEFSAIINPPQCAILAVGASRSIPIGQKAFKTMMTSCISYNAQAISEYSAAEFMESLRLHLENPSTLLSGSTVHVQRLAMGY